MSWVILQGAAVLIAKGERKHVVFAQFKELFESDAFKDFSAKIMQHLRVKEKSDPNKLGTLTETVLPYVNDNLQNVNSPVNK